MKLRCLACLLAVALGLAGCAGLGGRIPRAITTHDFGLPSDVSYRPVVPLRLIEVHAPSWLGSSAMQYRFADREDQRHLVFTENRWAAAPTELISSVLRRALTLERPRGGGCVLRVEIDEFSQVFEDAQRSHGLLAARAMVVSPRGDAVLAERRMTHRVAAREASAAGGAVALREAALDLSRAIHEWLGALEFHDWLGAANRPTGEASVATLCG